MADIELVIKISEGLKNDFELKQWTALSCMEMKNALEKATPLPKGHGRKLEKIVVEYPPADLCTYPEYRGKPYFSIKYEENGEHIIGFGTYKPEVLSRYIREYFISSQPDIEAIRQEIKKKLYRDSEWNEWVIREKDVMDIIDKHIQKSQDIPVMDYPQVEGVTPIVVSTEIRSKNNDF